MPTYSKLKQLYYLIPILIVCIRNSKKLTTDTKIRIFRTDSKVLCYLIPLRRCNRRKLNQITQLNKHVNYPATNRYAVLVTELIITQK